MFYYQIYVLDHLLINKTNISILFLFLIFSLFPFSIDQIVRLVFEGSFGNIFAFFGLLRSTLLLRFSLDQTIFYYWIFFMVISMFIDPDNCPQLWWKFFCGTYPNCTYAVVSPTGLRTVVTRVPVGCSYLFTSIIFYLKYISISLTNTYFFCLPMFFHWLGHL